MISKDGASVLYRVQFGVKCDLLWRGLPTNREYMFQSGLKVFPKILSHRINYTLIETNECHYIVNDCTYI